MRFAVDFGISLFRQKSVFKPYILAGSCINSIKEGEIGVKNVGKASFSGKRNLLHGGHAPDRSF
jgi:hypothetical protein